jgi:hypothetical protein
MLHTPAQKNETEPQFYTIEVYNDFPIREEKHKECMRQLRAANHTFDDNFPNFCSEHYFGGLYEDIEKFESLMYEIFGLLKNVGFVKVDRTQITEKMNTISDIIAIFAGVMERENNYLFADNQKCHNFLSECCKILQRCVEQNNIFIVLFEYRYVDKDFNKKFENNAIEAFQTMTRMLF